MDSDQKLNGNRPPARRNDMKSVRACFSFAAYARNVIEHLRKCRVPVARGLTDEEFSAIERSFGFEFPPDVRSILEEGLPVGSGFPNWRSGATRWEDKEEVRMMMDLPMAILSYDVAMGRFWWNDWGPRPSNTRRAFRIAAVGLSKAPILLPIYSNCYIPCSPCVAGNPVLFLRHGDFFYCGYDVSDFFHRHAFIPRDTSVSSRPRGGRVGDRIAQLLRDKFWEFDDDSAADYGTECRLIWEMEYLVRKNTWDIASAYDYFRQKPLSASAFSHFTMKAPPWAAKSVRRIEFWSDLVENKQTMNIAFYLSAKSPTNRVRWQDLATMNSNIYDDDADDLIINTKWVTNCLKDVERRLRNGGWKDEDICDVVNSQYSFPSSCDRSIKVALHNQNIKEMLALHFEMLSGHLRKAGWSAQDIVECFS